MRLDSSFFEGWLFVFMGVLDFMLISLGRLMKAELARVEAIFFLLVVFCVFTFGVTVVLTCLLNRWFSR